MDDDDVLRAVVCDYVGPAECAVMLKLATLPRSRRSPSVFSFLFFFFFYLVVAQKSLPPVDMSCDFVGTATVAHDS